MKGGGGGGHFCRHWSQFVKMGLGSIFPQYLLIPCLSLNSSPFFIYNCTSCATALIFTFNLVQQCNNLEGNQQSQSLELSDLMPKMLVTRITVTPPKRSKEGSQKSRGVIILCYTGKHCMMARTSTDIHIVILKKKIKFICLWPYPHLAMRYPESEHIWQMFNVGKI